MKNKESGVPGQRNFLSTSMDVFGVPKLQLITAIAKWLTVGLAEKAYL